MNGYVNLKEDYVTLFVSIFLNGDFGVNHLKSGIYKYFKEIFELNKPVYFSFPYGRFVCPVIKDFDVPSYYLVLDFVKFRVSVTVTEDDNVVLTSGG